MMSQLFSKGHIPYYSTSCKPGCKPRFRPGLQPGFRQVRAGLRHAFDFFVENLVANLLHQFRHVTHVWSALGCKQVCSWLSTCFRHAFDMLATCFRYAHASRKPDLQLARIMECGLNTSASNNRHTGHSGTQETNNIAALK